MYSPGIVPQSPDAIPRYLADELAKISNGLSSEIVGVDFDPLKNFSHPISPGPEFEFVDILVGETPVYINGCTWDSQLGQVTIGIEGLYLFANSMSRNTGLTGATGVGQALFSAFVAGDNAGQVHSTSADNWPDTASKVIVQYYEKGRSFVPQTRIIATNATQNTNINYNFTLLRIG